MTLSTAKAPMAIVLRVPTLNDEPADFTKLFQLWQPIREHSPLEVAFDFSSCRFLRQNAVAFLGGLARLVESRGGKPNFLWHTLNECILTNLAQNGFRAAFEGCSGGWQGNSIPYREDVTLENIPAYLEEQWLGRDWVQVDKDIKDSVVSTVLEIYSNAFEHGLSQIGVFSCGQRYPALKELKLTVIDFGVGIPFNVRQFQQESNILAENALRWAFQCGTTTRSGAVPGGTGLDTLKSFVKEKQGKIEIYSHDGYALMDKEQDFYQSAPTYFEGTLLNITLKCDPVHYSQEQVSLKIVHTF